MLESGEAGAEDQIAKVRQSIDGASTMTALFAERRRISERLASHPWEPVPPDPLDKKIDDEGPFLIIEPFPGRIYDFSSSSIARLAIAPVVIVFGYVAFRLARRRFG